MVRTVKLLTCINLMGYSTKFGQNSNRFCLFLRYFCALPKGHLKKSIKSDQAGYKNNPGVYYYYDKRQYVF
jgi:hypothetical protein